MKKQQYFKKSFVNPTLCKFWDRSFFFEDDSSNA